MVVSLLSISDEPGHHHVARFLHFQNLYKRNWRVNIYHVFHEANKATESDFLASHGYEFSFEIHLFTLSDCNLGLILRYDCLDISKL
ncbi:hypothetical protein LINPERPRIM_LOCUS7355 [Linum perenne]